MKFSILLFFLLDQIFSRKFNFLFNPRPIIGILSQSSFTSVYPSSKYSYVFSAYVKFLESSGARVVPIHYDSSEEELEMMVNAINGLMIPGGPTIWVDEKTKTEFNQFAKAGQYLLKLAIAKNLKGTYFPVWGTCLGHEVLLTTIANEPNIMFHYNSLNIRLKLNLSNAARSKLYNSIDKDLLEYIQTEEALFFNHNYALDIVKFYDNKILSDLFFITSTVTNHEGKEYISSIEGKHLPFYGVQYHPEKTRFDWNETLDISRTPKDIKVSQNFGNFFINEARKNNQHFSGKKAEHQYSIHQYSSLFLNGSIAEYYFFKNRKF